eukprot:GEMP01058804.1.p1 GENE.GEMP01058804.1~~GEMP01058804.1.p1  ORF type:complete len:259 (+),score=60.07 GEMP01058804.1:91-867(+)
MDGRKRHVSRDGQVRVLIPGHGWEVEVQALAPVQGPFLALPGRVFSERDLVFNGVTLKTIKQDAPRAKEDKELADTGDVVWDGSIALAKALEYHDAVRGCTVLELGAGCGLTGMAARLLGASRVILTDLEYCLDNMKRNCAVNELTNVEARKLDWRDPVFDFEPETDYVVIAADVLWLLDQVDIFVSAVATLWANAQKANVRSITLWICHQTRSQAVDDRFLKLLPFPVEAMAQHGDYAQAIMTIWRARWPVVSISNA